MKPTPMWRRLQRLLGPDVAGDADEELEHHIELRTRELIASGMEPGAARAEAMRRFGDVDRVRREVIEIDRGVERRSRIGGWVGELGQDLAYALRLLRRSRGFAIAAIGTLALGIGANTAVFSAVNSVLLRPLPVTEPDRLVMLWVENPERDWYMQTAAPANVLDWREQVDAFADAAAYSDFLDALTLTGEGDPQNVSVQAVMGNFFDVLGVRAQLGRTLTMEETWETTSPTLVLSDGAWRRLFAADPGILGRVVNLDGTSYEVVGVMPPSFVVPGMEADAWQGFGWAPAARTETWFRRAHFVRAVARLEPGATVEDATSQLEVVASRLEQEYPETNRLMGAGLTPLHDFLVSDMSTPLLALMGGVVLLLLLACANVGNLLLVRAMARRRELAVRGALGAGTGRLARQLLAESLLLSVIGAGTGMALAWVALRLLDGGSAIGLPASVGISLDPRFAAYVIGVTVFSTAFFALVPGVLAARQPAAEALKEGGRAGSGRPARRAAGVLVAAEVALALLLVTGAVLLVRSLDNLQRVDPGFDSTGVLTGSLEIPATRYESEAEVVAFYDQLREELSSLPGVTEVAAVRQLPLTTTSWTSSFLVEGRTPEEAGLEVVHREVTTGYFEALRVPLLQGRTFSSGDRPESTPVIVINQALAEEYFPNSDPIGQRIAFTGTPDSTSRWWTVVGVVGNERQANPAQAPRIEIFAPITQEVTRGVSLVIRSSGDPAALAGPVRERIRAMDRDLVVDNIRTMDAVSRAATAREEFLALLFTSFAIVALVLALVGVYGVMAQSIRSRTREIGIRLALGAEKHDVVTLLARHSLTLLASGIVIGGLIALYTAEGLSSLLYGIAPRDPLTLIGTAILLLLAGLLAASIPAVRAGRIDPAAILRND